MRNKCKRVALYPDGYNRPSQSVMISCPCERRLGRPTIDNSRLCLVTHVFQEMTLNLASSWVPTRFLSQCTTMLKNKGLMRIIMLLSVLCSARLASSATLPPVQPIISPPDDVLSANIPTRNITAIGAIDPRFSIKATHSNVKIPENDCLMNVIIAMGTLSARKFTDPIEPAAYIDGRYLGARVVTKGATRRGLIQPRYLLWGLYQAIRPMIQWDSWKVSDFTLLWDGEIVGFVSFEETGYESSSLQGSQNNIAQSRRSTPPLDSLGIYSPVDPSQENSSLPNPIVAIDVKPTSYGKPMLKVYLFMAIVECFLYLAPRPAAEPLVAFSVAPVPYDATLRLAPVVRTEAPSFDYGVAALGLATVPSKFISEREQKWSEVVFDYFVDGVLIGQGSITRILG